MGEGGVRKEKEEIIGIDRKKKEEGKKKKKRQLGQIDRYRSIYIDKEIYRQIYIYLSVMLYVIFIDIPIILEQYSSIIGIYIM